MHQTEPMQPSKTRVLMLSTDAAALAKDSAVRKRLAAYAERLGALTVLVIGARGARAEEGNLVIEAVPAARLLRPWAAARAVREKLDRGAFDVVSAQDPFETGRAALNGIRRSRSSAARQTPLHLQIHTDFLSPWFARDSLKNRIRARIADGVLPQASGVRVVSERIKKSLVARYGTRIPVPSVIPIVVPLPDDTAAPLPPLAAPISNPFALIAVGRLESEKRFGDILKALARVRARYPNAVLYIVGDGREKARLMAQARALGIADAVSWLGWRADAPALMRSANAFIQASAYEGYGMTLVEAALARLPIITTDVGIVGEVLKPERDALVAPVGDVSALAQAIIRLIEDNNLRANLGSDAAHTARNHLMAGMAQPDEIAEDLANAARTTPAAGASLP